MLLRTNMFKHGPDATGQRQPINRSGPRLIHDPSDNRFFAGVVPGRSSPDTMKYTQCPLLGIIPSAGESRGQRKDDTMRPLIQRMERTLIACGDRMDELHPVLFGHERLPLIGIKHVSEGCG